MDNQTKRYISSLEARILKLENMFEAISIGMQQTVLFTPYCNQCGAHDPEYSSQVQELADRSGEDSPWCKQPD